jgi:hypothetical protein
MRRFPVSSMVSALRWYGVVLPLAAAVAASAAAAYLWAHGGNQWCGSNSFSCSVDTNLIGVVAIGGATTYWYFGIRRAVLLARYRHRLRTQLTEVASDDGGEASSRVLALCRDPRRWPRVVLVTGPSGSEKAEVYARTVARLSGPGNWTVPVRLGEITSGSPQDVLAAARQQLELVLLDVNADQGLIDWLWRSLLRTRRLLLVVEDVEAIAPSVRAVERGLVAQRLFMSTQRLRLPLLGTGRPDLVESAQPGIVELYALDRESVRERLARGVDLDERELEVLSAAVTGALATPFMIDRVVWLVHRAPAVTADAVARARVEVRDLMLWDQLLAEHAVPGATLRPAGLRLLAFTLVRGGLREMEVPDGSLWRAALALDTGNDITAGELSAAEIRSYVEGGFLDAGSSRRLLRFASPEIQATVAAGFLATRPDLVGELVDGCAGTRAGNTPLAVLNHTRH